MDVQTIDDVALRAMLEETTQNALKQADQIADMVAAGNQHAFSLVASYRADRLLMRRIHRVLSVEVSG